MLKNILLTLFVMSVNEAGRAEIPKLELTLYYESNCPDSKAFVLRQLLPATRRLHRLVTTRFVPFGKAMSTGYEFEAFECQHGPSECLGNLVQDCVLDSMQDRSNLDRTLYVACEMETYAASMGSYECVEKAGVPVSKVQYCVERGRGEALQMNSEYLSNLVPHVKRFVPTVTINGVFDQRMQDSAMVDLFGTLCSLIPHTMPCATHHNRQALQRIMYGTETYTFYALGPNLIHQQEN